MSKIGKTISIIVMLILAHGGICFCEATPAESSVVLVPIGSPFKVKFEPVSHPKSSGPVNLKFQVRSFLGCDKATVTIVSVNKLEYSGPISWVAEFKDDSTYSTVFQVVIPPNDTSSIKIKIEGCGDRNQGPLYFLTTGDTIVVTHGNPNRYRPNPQPKSDEIRRDTLTEEQLQTEYEIALDLSDPAHLRIAERILGPLPDSCKYKGRKGCYMLNVSLDNLIKLADGGVEFNFLTPPPWDRRYSPMEDSLPPQPRKSDSIGTHGAIFPKGGARSPDGLSLDHVVGLSPQGDLLADQEITFHLRLNNNTWNNIIGSTNGFRVYSPDGAQWEPITYDTAAAGWDNMYEYVFFSPFSVTGSGADTIGFGGYKIFLDGIHPGFDGVDKKDAHQADRRLDLVSYLSCWMTTFGDHHDQLPYRSQRVTAGIFIYST